MSRHRIVGPDRSIMAPIVWSILLIVAGLVVIGIELFVPSAGILGVLAGALIVAGIVAAFLQNLVVGTIVLVATSLSLPVLIALAIKIWPSTPIGKRILIGAMTEEEVLPQVDLQQSLQALIGHRGIAKTKMLPSGIVWIEDRNYDAISDGFAIEPGTPVEVIAIRTKRVVVRPLSAEELSQSAPIDSADLLARPIDQLGLESLEE